MSSSRKMKKEYDMSYISKSEPPDSDPNFVYYYLSAGKPYLSLMWTQLNITYVVRFKCVRRAEEAADLVKEGILSILGLQNNPEYFGVKDIFKESIDKATMLFHSPFIHRSTIRKVKYPNGNKNC